jgi:hypothetical protein
VTRYRSQGVGDATVTAAPAAPAAALPATGGISLLALGVGALLVGGEFRIRLRSNAPALRLRCSSLEVHAAGWEDNAGVDAHALVQDVPFPDDAARA